MSRAPKVSGIHHVTLTVSDLDASVAWYRKLLGFDEVKRVGAGGLQKVMLARDGIALILTSHGDLAEPGLL